HVVLQRTHSQEPVVDSENTSLQSCIHVVGIAVPVHDAVYDAIQSRRKATRRDDRRPHFIRRMKKMLTWTSFQEPWNRPVNPRALVQNFPICRDGLPGSWRAIFSEFCFRMRIDYRGWAKRLNLRKRLVLVKDPSQRNPLAGDIFIKP